MNFIFIEITEIQGVESFHKGQCQYMNHQNSLKMLCLLHGNIDMNMEDSLQMFLTECRDYLGTLPMMLRVFR